MRGHAGAEIEGDAIEMIAAAGGTIRSALLEAGDMRVAIIPAARALREVAAERGEMTDLRRRKATRCRGNAGIVFRDAREAISSPDTAAGWQMMRRLERRIRSTWM